MSAEMQQTGREHFRKCTDLRCCPDAVRRRLTLSLRKETDIIGPFEGPVIPVLPVFGWALLAVLSTTACLDPAPRLRAAGIVDICNGIADGALCNDQNSCTVGDTCQSQICVGTVAVDGTPCTDGNQCTRGDVCGQGVCTGTQVADGFPCTDGEPCTQPDICLTGQCTPGLARFCDDGIACTMDSCVTGIGCRFDVTAACPDGAAGDALPGDGSPPPDGSDSGPADVPGGTDGTAGQDADATDAVTSDADGPAGADADSGGGGTDAQIADAGDGPGGDGGPDAETDGPEDGPQDAGVDAGGSDAPDAVADATGPDNPTNLFEARGGACVCEIGAAPPLPATLLGVAIAGLIVIRRRRAPRKL
jgi:hypothetical protein